LGVEVAVLHAGLGVGLHHPVEQLLQAALTGRRAHHTAEVLAGDDVGGIDGPERRELDTALLEVHRAVPPVGHHHIALLPFDLVVRVHALGGEDPLELQSGPLGSPGLPGLARSRARPHGLCHANSLTPALRAGASRPCSLLAVAGRFAVVVRLVALRLTHRGPQVGDLLLEVLDRLEGAVHAREPQVGHPVQLPQRAEDGQPDLVARHLGQACRSDGLLDLVRQLLQVVLAHRPPFARPPDAVDDLLPTELFGDAGPLHHREYHRFGRGEPAAALRARTAPPDRLAVIHFPGIDHTRILVPAERAPHATTSGTSTTTHQPTHHTPCLRWTPRARIGDRLVDRRWTTHRLLWTTTSSATQIVEQLHA